MAIIAKNGDSVRLSDYSTYIEDGHLWASLTYIIENDRNITEIKIPKVSLGIMVKPNTFEVRLEFNSYAFPDVAHVDIGMHRFPITLGDTYEAENVYFTEKILEEKRTEMTLEEIEEKLGYKIKIVSEKENQND